MVTAADVLVNTLCEWGVSVVFGLPGDGINGIMEALRKERENIRFVQVRHEESAAFMACAYAKYTGKLGVCLATSGPGGIHLLNGLYDAKLDGQPVLAITGHHYHDLIDTHAQQDVDLDKVYMDVALYNARVMGPSHVEEIANIACRTALGRRGVAHINFPVDFQEQEIEEHSKRNVPGHVSHVLASAIELPPETALKNAAAELNQGKRVAILAGQGALAAGAELEESAEKLAAPIVKALLGKAVVPDDHPHTTGGVGLLGTAPSQEALTECDTLIIAGSSFPYLEFYPKPGKAKCVQIDIDPARIGLRYPADVGLAGQCWDVLRALLPLIEAKKDRTFLATCQSRMKRWNELMVVRGSRRDKPLKPQVVIHELNRFLADDAIICCDTGTLTTWAARHIRIRGEMQFSASGTLASMANGLPYSVGASAAFPGRQIVCVVGDGGFSMLMAEMATLVKYDMPVKVILLKNDVLGMIKWEQLAFEGNPQYGVQLQPIDFEAFARACGAGGFTVDDPAKVPAVLEAAFRHPGPALVQAVVDPNEPPLPGKITTEQAWHFAEALAKGTKDRWEIIKTVVENKIREVV